MLYPLVFEPLLKERIWGGRKLQELYRKPLPADAPIGESWEICDRPQDQSVIANGTFTGKTLGWLMEHHRDALLGPGRTERRFPLLLKIIDAREVLSLQVHPPAARAIELNGEPKTEMWYVAQAGAHAKLFVGLKRGTTRAAFEAAVEAGTVADCFHQIEVEAGDCMFLPSGRVHALGAGIVIFEIQQNSDTTYRVHDWNRVDAAGNPRQLHLAESLKSIDFDDFEPDLTRSKWTDGESWQMRNLADNPLFQVNECKLGSGKMFGPPHGVMQILALLEGEATLKGEGVIIGMSAGSFCLIPAACGSTQLSTETSARFLTIGLGS